MEFRSFDIRNYRAITGPLTVDVARRRLLPIIGINESGKTTVLQAIFAFDYHNDTLNSGRHLADIANLYSTNPGIPLIAALVDCDRAHLREVLDEYASKSPEAKAWTQTVRRKALPTKVTIVRNLRTKTYTIGEAPLRSVTHQDGLARAIIRHLPYILYFDDFRDKVEETIAIPEDKETSLEGWAAILQQLFEATDESLSISALPGMEERQRKTVLAKVQKHLNGTLTKEWQTFRLDDREALKIGIEYEQATRELKLEIVERDAQGNEHFFFISDRSKGFYWFFNFVMKLEFNPKVTGANQGSIYLLDEPGSYLHATAQTRLCNKLRSLAERNTVLYCTHSHYLLDPEVIPLSSVAVADKDGNGNISLVPIHEHQAGLRERRSAFQPLIDALQIKPFVLDLTGSRALLVEGVYDYYCLELFRRDRPITVLASVGADSIRFYVSLLLGWQVKFRVLWDNDQAGRNAYQKAVKLFGNELANNVFQLLPLAGGANRKMQDLFDGADFVMIRRELGLGAGASFEKTIAALFFAPQKTELVNQMSARTHQNFAELWEVLASNL